MVRNILKREWLVAYRVAKNLSQDDVAKAIGVTQMTISNIENGIRRPSPQVAQALGRIFKFDWTKFYEDTSKVT